MTERLLTVNETAEKLQIQPGTLRKWICRSGKGFPVKPVRVGRAVRFAESKIDALILGELEN